jgi:hypothetical protein
MQGDATVVHLFVKVRTFLCRIWLQHVRKGVALDNHELLCWAKIAQDAA